MTEEEAKTKWCHRGFRDDMMRATCIGSECMAWRWSQKRNPDWKPDHSMMVSGWQQHPDDKAPMYIADDANGYCGLAGRP